LPHEMAWHSGLADDVRKAIVQRLLSGQQRILITSPESFVGPLSRYLYQTASEGRLKYFVVDEAHLVAQWGNDFRPEFQAMSGLRRDLLTRCPATERFRTLLLSATLTQESYDVLETLFTGDTFESVNAVALRPEPEYWISPSPTKAERDAKVSELVQVVPRPFLIYVTTKADADAWDRNLHRMGIVRHGCVHGGTPYEQRERVIRAWRAGDIDCVVATSAFGLGMDKADVRAVIHACIPESIDRYYQEVGRAGRDGKAAVSFLLPCDAVDRATAQSISQERIITLEKGLERWKSMINARTARWVSDRNVWSVDLNTRLPHIEQDSEANVAWNLRTLVLLNRAGVIRLEAAEPPTLERNVEESEAAFMERRKLAMDQYFATAHLSVVNPRHSEVEIWQKVVQDERRRMCDASWQSFARIESLLKGKQEIGALLQRTYAVQTSTRVTTPEPLCSGCPECRRQGIESSFHFNPPEPDLVRGIEHGSIAHLQKLFNTEASVVFVRCDVDVNDRRDIRHVFLRILQQLVERGIDELAVPEHWKKERDWQNLYERSARRFIISSRLDEYDLRKNDLRLPRLTALFHEQTPVIENELLTMERPFHVILAPESAIDVYNHGNFFDRNPFISLHELVRRLDR
jgi:ATP-dependent DNA helicase RecQ